MSKKEKRQTIDKTTLLEKSRFLRARNLDIGVIIIMAIAAMTLISIAGPLMFADGGHALYVSGLSFSIAAALTILASIGYLIKLIFDVKHLTDIEKVIRKKRK